jgi:hypothetical protein
MNPIYMRRLIKVSTLLFLVLSLLFTAFHMLKPVNAQNITEIEVIDYPSQARPGDMIEVIVILHYSAHRSFSTTLQIVDEERNTIAEEAFGLDLPPGDHTGTAREFFRFEVPEFDAYPHRWHLSAEADSISTPFEIEIIDPDSPPIVEITSLKNYVGEFEERYQLYEGERSFIVGIVHVSISEDERDEALFSIKYKNSPQLYSDPENRPAEGGWFYYFESESPADFSGVFILSLNAPLDYPIDSWEWSFKAEVEIRGEVQASDTKSLTLSVSERSYSWATIDRLSDHGCARPNAEFNVRVSGPIPSLKEKRKPSNLP